MSSGQCHAVMHIILTVCDAYCIHSGFATHKRWTESVLVCSSVSFCVFACVLFVSNDQVNMLSALASADARCTFPSQWVCTAQEVDEISAYLEGQMQTGVRVYLGMDCEWCEADTPSVMQISSVGGLWVVDTMHINTGCENTATDGLHDGIHSEAAGIDSDALHIDTGSKRTHKEGQHAHVFREGTRTRDRDTSLHGVHREGEVSRTDSKQSSADRGHTAPQTEGTDTSNKGHPTVVAAQDARRGRRETGTNTETENADGGCSQQGQAQQAQMKEQCEGFLSSVSTYSDCDAWQQQAPGLSHKTPSPTQSIQYLCAVRRLIKLLFTRSCCTVVGFAFGRDLEKLSALLPEFETITADNVIDLQEIFARKRQRRKGEMPSLRFLCESLLGKTMDKTHQVFQFSFISFFQLCVLFLHWNV